MNENDENNTTVKMNTPIGEISLDMLEYHEANKQAKIMSIQRNSQSLERLFESFWERRIRLTSNTGKVNLVR